jgi:hypothetical protein
MAALHGEALEQALEVCFSGDTVVNWVERLTRAGIGAHRHIADLETLDIIANKFLRLPAVHSKVV